jgi:hypothetical protein
MDKYIETTGLNRLYGAIIAKRRSPEKWKGIIHHLGEVSKNMPEDEHLPDFINLLKQ